MTPPLRFEGLEAVRRRPGMYIGGNDQRALHGCVFELVANSIEQHLDGRCSSLTVTIHSDGSLSVQDDGPGISVAADAQHGVSFIELAFTKLNFVPADESRQRRPSVGWTGVGAKCVNAVSEWMQIDTNQGTGTFRILFARGQVSEPLRALPEPEFARGTRIRFKPDHEIFGAATFDRKSLEVMLEPLAVLHPGFSVCLVDERLNDRNRHLVSHYKYPHGVVDFLELQAPLAHVMKSDILVLEGEAHGVKCLVGFRFVESMSTSLLTFVNDSPTPLGGTHLQGFLEGLTGVLNKTSRSQRPFNSQDVRLGLAAVVAIWLALPRFNGSTKNELANEEVRRVVFELTTKGLEHWVADPGRRIEWVIDFIEEQRSGISGAT
jgi:DNA gyrase subunit B